MRSFLDDFWESVKARYPRLKHFDVIRDQSHIHHTLVTVLGFGALGMFAAAALWPGVGVVANQGLAIGVVGGLVGYVIREAWPRLIDHERAYWDGTLDVLVPLMVAGPWAASALLGVVPLWSGPLLYVSAALVAYLYTFGRPAGMCHYDRSKDPK